MPSRKSLKHKNLKKAIGSQAEGYDAKTNAITQKPKA
jgi:hypothetical protein